MRGGRAILLSAMAAALAACAAPSSRAPSPSAEAPALGPAEAEAAYARATRCGAVHLAAVRAVGSEGLGEAMTQARVDDFAAFLGLAADARDFALAQGAEVGRVPVDPALAGSARFNAILAATQREMEALAGDYAGIALSNIRATGTFMGDGASALPRLDACEAFRRDAARWAISRVSRTEGR